MVVPTFEYQKSPRSKPKKLEYRVKSVFRIEKSACLRAPRFFSDLLLL